MHPLLAVIAGALVAAQGAMNAGMKGYIGNAALAALINNVIGALALLVLVILSQPTLPSGSRVLSIPGYYWIAGVLGASFVWASATVVPKLGVSTTLALVIAGQMAGAMIIDQFGLLGMQQRSAGSLTWAGLILIVVGSFVLARSR